VQQGPEKAHTGEPRSADPLQAVCVLPAAGAGRQPHCTSRTCKVLVVVVKVTMRFFLFIDRHVANAQEHSGRFSVFFFFECLADTQLALPVGTHKSGVQ